MEILLNPNIAYVLLVIGLMMGLLAIVTPGSGVLEVGAFFLLAIAAFTVYRLGLNLWALIVLILSVFPFIYAIRQPKRELFLALSLLGLIAGSLYIFPTTGWLPAVNPFVAVITSALAAGAVWFVTRKTILAHAARPAHDLGALIGQIGETRTPVHENGSVQVAGELWSARSRKPIPTGKSVRVAGREGFVVEVEPASEPGSKS